LWKKNLFGYFQKHAAFITGSQYTGHLNEVNTEGGLLAFNRLDFSVDFYRYCSAFQPKFFLILLTQEIPTPHID
jgi:hypothetical protein